MCHTFKAKTKNVFLILLCISGLWSECAREVSGPGAEDVHQVQVRDQGPHQWPPGQWGRGSQRGPGQPRVQLWPPAPVWRGAGQHQLPGQMNSNEVARWLVLFNFIHSRYILSWSPSLRYEWCDLLSTCHGDHIYLTRHYCRATFISGALCSRPGSRGGLFSTQSNTSCDITRPGRTSTARAR